MNIPGVAGFTPSRLTLARERVGMTQKTLSQHADVSVRTIKGYESGEYPPSQDTLEAMAKAIGYPASFFEAEPLDALTLEAASFRALTKASGGLRRRTIAAGTLAMEFYDFVSKGFELPPVAVPDLRHQKPPRAAETLRHLWGIGQRPIKNMIHRVEKHGVRVMSLSEDCEAIDAFSLWKNGSPYMFLNARKTAERGIWDVAHELGHLTLHRHGAPQGQIAEREADEFAANFLLPENAIRAAAPRMATIASVAHMKAKWRVATSALGRRLHELGAMSDWHYRQFNIELSRRGRKNEPAPIARETSSILGQILATLAQEGVGLRDLAKSLHLPVSELRAFSFGLQMVPGEAAVSSERRGQLRLVT